MLVVPGKIAVSVVVVAVFFVFFARSSVTIDETMDLALSPAPPSVSLSLAFFAAACLGRVRTGIEDALQQRYQRREKGVLQAQRPAARRGLPQLRGA